MTLELTENDERVLATLVTAYNINPGEAVIRAIHEAAANRHHKATRARR
ncbi:hypothetical protein J2X28_000199 [Kocuria rhizophila]|nr:hypothetical protein [Kocuria rhizophila]MDR7373243.1 hypothetical protein [Kocuria rhizophila]